jgi:hypothetical protein
MTKAERQKTTTEEAGTREERGEDQRTSDQATQGSNQLCFGGAATDVGDAFRKAYHRYLHTLQQVHNEWGRKIQSSYADSCRAQLELWLVQIGTRGPQAADEAGRATAVTTQEFGAAAWSSIDGSKKAWDAYLAFLKDVQSAFSGADLERLDTSLLLGIGNSLVAVASYARSHRSEAA